MIKNHNKVYLISMISLALATLLCAGLLYFILDAIASASATIAAERKEVALMQSQDTILDSFIKNQSKYEPAMQAIGRSLVDPADPVDFIRFLERSSADTGVTADISIAALAARTASKGIGFEIYAYGNFSNIVRFAQHLEYGPYLVKINSMDIKKNIKDPATIKPRPGDTQAYLLIQALTK